MIAIESISGGSGVYQEIKRIGARDELTLHPLEESHADNALLLRTDVALHCKSKEKKKRLLSASLPRTVPGDL